MFLKHLPTTFETTRRHEPENRNQNSHRLQCNVAPQLKSKMIKGSLPRSGVKIGILYCTVDGVRCRLMWTEADT